MQFVFTIIKESGVFCTAFCNMEVRIIKMVRFEPITKETAVPPVDCGEEDIQRMMSEAYEATLIKQGMAYNILRNGRIVGQFMIRLYIICDSDYGCSVGGNQFACIKVEYLGIEKKLQGEGIGTDAMKGIIILCRRYIKNLPIRFIYIEAVQNREGWFSGFSFERLPVSISLTNTNNVEYTVPMYIDFMDHDAVDEYVLSLS